MLGPGRVADLRPWGVTSARVYGGPGSKLDFRGLGGDVFDVFPGQADGVDFFWFWLVSVKLA
jgi:hypothetical protein